MNVFPAPAGPASALAAPDAPIYPLLPGPRPMETKPRGRGLSGPSALYSCHPPLSGRPRRSAGGFQGFPSLPRPLTILPDPPPPPTAIGLIAGGGRLPIIIAQGLRELGHPVHGLGLA